MRGRTHGANRQIPDLAGGLSRDILSVSRKDRSAAVLGALLSHRKYISEEEPI